jgi:hypothetical protein
VSHDVRILRATPSANGTETSSGFVAVSSAGSARPRDNLPPGSLAGEQRRLVLQSSKSSCLLSQWACVIDSLCGPGIVTLYEGSIADMPEDYASRRERFSELDELQTGWVVRLSSRNDGGTVDATFTSPAGAPTFWEIFTLKSEIYTAVRKPTDVTMCPTRRLAGCIFCGSSTSCAGSKEAGNGSRLDEDQERVNDNARSELCRKCICIAV